VYYPVPIHRQTPFAGLGLDAAQLPVTDRLVGEILSIPVHPSLSDEEVGTVITAVNETAAEVGPPPSDG
jgi:dTDP-4-amino-4,6-dideoxygalactose transaminase